MSKWCSSASAQMYRVFLAFANAIVVLRTISSFIHVMRTHLEPEHIRSFLASRRRRTIDDPNLRRAAVLILLYPKEGIPYVLLTKRTSIVEHHKGQISFPGGSADEGDRSLIETALRETTEEIGLDASTVQILGLYDDQWTPTGFSITPVVGHLLSLPRLQLNHHEVEEIVEIPVSLFLDSANVEIRRMERAGKTVDVHYYRYGDYEIWGATAAILRSFLADVAAAGSPGAEDTPEGEKNSLDMT